MRRAGATGGGGRGGVCKRPKQVQGSAQRPTRSSSSVLLGLAGSIRAQQGFAGGGGCAPCCLHSPPRLGGTCRDCCDCRWQV